MDSQNPGRALLRDHPDPGALIVPRTTDSRWAGLAAGPPRILIDPPRPTAQESGADVIAYLVRRILWIIPVLFVVSVITFFLMHSVPGGPWDREKRAARSGRGSAQRRVRPGPAALHPVRQLGRGLRHRATSVRHTGTRTGASTTSSRTASRTTVHLGLMAFRSPSWSASRSGSSPPSATTAGRTTCPPAVSIIGIATPSFVLAILLIVFFGVTLRMVPDRWLEGTRILGPAHDRPGRLPDRRHRPVHARLHARGHAQGLHPDGP